MTSMMADVIRRGTARTALALGREDLAGKTGTTDEWRDAWFSGFNSALLATAWVGFDQPRSLGEGETGGHAALAMWIDFMGQALKDVPEQPLPPPPGIVTARIDPDTGLLAGPEQRNAVSETFQEDSIPTRVADKPLTDKAASPEMFRTMEQAF
jgi:penicillin-binding protein 1A